MKIFYHALLVICLALVSGGLRPAAAAEHIIRSTHVFPSTHPWHKGLEKFKEIIEQTSGGRIQVQNYPAGQISGGNNRTMNEQVQVGTLQLLIQSPPSWSGLAPKAQIFNLPFLFPDTKTALQVAQESGIAREIITEAFAGLGVTALGIWENGFRHLTSRSKIVHKPEDMKGLKIRIPPTPLLTEVFKALGALPVSMNMVEVYTALQQGAVDAQENPVSAIASNKIFEVAPKITLWKYCWDPGIATINTKFYESLPADLQKAVAEAIAEAGRYVNDLVAREDVELLEAFKKSGAEIYFLTPEESRVFADFLKPIYDQFAPVFGADKIENLRRSIAEAAAQSN